MELSSTEMTDCVNTTEVFQSHALSTNNSLQPSLSWEASATQKFPRILCNRNVYQTFTRACHLSIFWARLIPPKPSHPVSLTYILTSTNISQVIEVAPFLYVAPNVPSAPLISFSLILLPASYFLSNINHGAPSYEIFPVSFYFLLLMPKYLPQHLILEHP